MRYAAMLSCRISVVDFRSSARHRTITPPWCDSVAAREWSDPSRTWCGPAALSALTGCSVELATLLCARVRFGIDADGPIPPEQLARVRGTWITELAQAAGLLGFHFVNTRRDQDGNEDFRLPTLAAWLRENGHRPEPHLIGTTTHWLAYGAGRVADNRSGLISAGLAEYRRARVFESLRVVRTWVVDYDRLAVAAAE